MKYIKESIELITKHKTYFFDITDKVNKIITDSKIKNGHILIQSQHTTTGLYLNENEKYLLEDFVKYLETIIPKDGYNHDNIAERDCPSDEPMNGHSHIKAAFYSNPSLYLILYDGKLEIGKYQRIFFAEFDGPCPRKHKDKRKTLVSIIGE